MNLLIFLWKYCCHVSDLGFLPTKSNITFFQLMEVRDNSEMDSLIDLMFEGQHLVKMKMENNLLLHERSGQKCSFTQR